MCAYMYASVHVCISISIYASRYVAGVYLCAWVYIFIYASMFIFAFIYVSFKPKSGGRSKTHEEDNQEETYKTFLIEKM